MDLRVYCSGMELEEYGEALAVGDEVTRPGIARAGGAFFGSWIDGVPWEFDRYWSLWPRAEAARISGVVTAVRAVFARIELRDDGEGQAWSAISGSAWTEPLPTTRRVRRMRPRIPKEPGWHAASPAHGDERHYGFVVDLTDAALTPLERPTDA